MFRVGALVRGIWVHEDQSNWRCMCVSVGGCGMPYKSLPMRMLLINTHCVLTYVHLNISIAKAKRAHTS